MNILDPPKSYIDFRCALHGVPDDEIGEKKRRFYKANEGARAEITRFMKWLEEARMNMTLPVEKIEIREFDGKRHGRVAKMIIYDIEYFIEENQIRQRKSYVPLESIHDTLRWGNVYSFYNVGRKDAKKNHDHSSL